MSNLFKKKYEIAINEAKIIEVMASFCSFDIVHIWVIIYSPPYFASWHGGIAPIKIIIFKKQWFPNVSLKNSRFQNVLRFDRH